MPEPINSLTFGQAPFLECPRAVEFRVQVPERSGVAAFTMTRTARFSCITQRPSDATLMAQYTCPQAPFDGVTVQVELGPSFLDTCANDQPRFTETIRAKVAADMTEAFTRYRLWERLPLPVAASIYPDLPRAETSTEVSERLAQRWGVVPVDWSVPPTPVRITRRSDEFTQAQREFLSLPEEQRNGRLGP